MDPMNQPNYGQSPQPQGPKQLVRDTQDKWVAGVCSGVAHYFNLDPNLVRLLFAAATFISAGTGAVIYLVLWVIMPVQ